MNPLRERPATWLALALVVLAAWEIGELAHVHAAAPTDRDWRAAAEHVAGARQDGDLIVFAPDWVDPVGRRWLGRFISLDDAGRMDVARYARVWEVSVRGASAPETKGLGKPAETSSFGAVRVRRFDQKPALVTWRAHDGGPVLEVAHHPRRCLELVGRRQFLHVELGAELQVYAGLADVWARRDNRAFALVRVLVDGAEVSRASVGNDSGWLALPAVKTAPGAHDVSFEVSVDPDHGDPRRARLDVCLAAEARSRP